MEQSPVASTSSQQPSVSHRPNMDAHLPVTEDPLLWNWDDLLDLSVDFPLSLVSDHNQQPQPSPPIPDNPPTERVRKRDPRLTCSNFLAGNVPCACPEVDALMEEEAEVLPGKKRARVGRSGPGNVARCQVAGCEADISELKGYHKRHKVCLRCAHASAVLIDGETKRYCQQCGKFHLLPDFDEGKRSCRRKLERHNRRRRKLIESRGAIHKEQEGDLQTEDAACEGEAGKDTLCITSQIADEEPLLESEDGHLSDVHLTSELQNINSDSVASFMASGGTPTDVGKDDTKYSLSSSYCDNKSAHSSVCPTGRISFKLFDWNPAEFPRRLRLQILQWLANMPVELEGYIRPGCTILTVFIAMPTFMWEKLFKSPVSYIEDFVLPSGRMLSGRGCMIVYINNLVFRFIEGGPSVTKVSVKVRAPRLHCIYPTCFEAGKPMEFVACGSNLLQPKFRFLVSFAGKYLASDYRVTAPHGRSYGDSSSFDHQSYKIYIPQTEPNFFGPAFVEVENESGLSNFIPLLVGDEEICSEMKIIQQRFDQLQSVAGDSLSHSCEVTTFRQTAFSEILLDIAWLLKEPASEDFQKIMASSQIQRFNCVLNFLIQNESIIILEKLLANIKIILDRMRSNNVLNGITEEDVRLLQKYMDNAKEILNLKFQRSEDLIVCSECTEPKEKCGSRSCSWSNLPSVLIPNQDAVIRANDKLGLVAGPTILDRSETVPLLNREVVMNINLVKEWPRRLHGPVLSSTVFSSRSAILVITTAAVCFGICAVLLHPKKVGEFAVSVSRCLSNKF
ncbi:SBP domain-containing protein [Cephalotus follicularis]|uniref:SBP domain-containing protein n=1 Tax=Cephalotus follicularis TaxID=3775 RepID=A0A1Q3B664_CEPFO|nr:SBP domain-containing protein [Cephalotus follicularis]